VSFEAELESCLPALRAFARRLARRSSDVDDLVQETMVSALVARDSFAGGMMMSWLFAILRNKFFNSFRKASHRRKRTEEVAISSRGVWLSEGPPAPDSRWRGQDAIAALDRILPEYKDVVMAVEVEGLRYKEAARKLGCPIGTVMSRLHRARAACARAAP
jgi:RNA polymerase sigma factor (sigma-70 family)